MKRYNKFIVLFAYIFITNFHQHIQSIETVETKQPRILFIEPWLIKFPGGVANTLIAQAKTFHKYNTFFLTCFVKSTFLESQFKHYNLPYCIFSQPEVQGSIPAEALKEDVIQLCKKHNINIVVTPRWQDISVLQSIAQGTSLKIIFNRFSGMDLEGDGIVDNIHVLENLDGVLSDYDVIRYISHVNETQNLKIKQLKAICYFWDEEKFLSFYTNEKRASYFINQFNVEVGEYPIVCTIANFYHPCKNYPLLIKAVDQLINKKQYKFHLMIAGTGPLKEPLEQLVQELHLQEYVHFLGSVSNIPAVLYHSDMHVLPSYSESVSLANLEAGCMKKPVIVAQEVSASYFINDGVTGLLFKNNNSDDLAQKIEYLLINPQYRIQLGENAYYHINQKYSNKTLYNEWLTFLSNLL